MRPIRLIMVAAIMSACLLTTSTANARTEWVYDKDFGNVRSLEFDVMGFLWPFGASTHIGGAAWLGYPILETGFIPLNDSLYLEGGAYIAYFNVDVGHDATYDFLAVIPAVGARWNLHLTEQWTAFITGKIGFRIGFGAAADNELVPSFTIGAIWEFSRAMFLRLETGNYGVLMAGVGFPL